MTKIGGTGSAGDLLVARGVVTVRSVVAEQVVVGEAAYYSCPDFKAPA
jgi:hypothetical protein